MYAIFQNKKLCHLCDDKAKFLKIFEPENGHEVFVVESLEDLKQVFKSYEQPESHESYFESLIQHLESINVDDKDAEKFFAKVKDNGEKLVGQARSLGVRGLKNLSDSFVVLSDLLQEDKSTEKEEK